MAALAARHMEVTFGLMTRRYREALGSAERAVLYPGHVMIARQLE